MTKPRASAPPTSSTASATISASVFKATCLELMDEIAATGSDVIVTKHGRPVVRVGPATIAPASPVGFMRGTIVRHGDLIASDEEGWATTQTDPLLTRGR
ncbi:type II toxin-antitoxin system prevent-host-death family antitoxin [Gemmatimonas sp.]|uniref:type II toxin-antitoxin system Phd/YefM family antitoxin n=1 Tax=Gemmatimonas sp. TaxID=1962908 RepID=UPI00286A4BA8|nr:type II toxin-antitoxin system prevent-host-death family antitoxin [Gemmatimonas sp.]